MDGSNIRQFLNVWITTQHGSETRIATFLAREQLDMFQMFGRDIIRDHSRSRTKCWQSRNAKRGPYIQNERHSAIPNLRNTFREHCICHRIRERRSPPKAIFGVLKLDWPYPSESR